MPEANLKERLQPALLDRLIDEARFVTTYFIAADPAAMQRLQISERDLLDILFAQGLKLKETASRTAAGNDALALEFSVSAGAVSPAQLKQLVLKPPGAPQGVSLQSFCAVESRTALNQDVESADRAMLSSRKLRESVQRDLGWLLNSTSLDTVQALDRYPQVARSVVNFGMPSFAGKALHAIDPQQTARRIRETIEAFEPRLSRVQVTPETDKPEDGVTLAFRIEAELWGHPASQHLIMKTSIDIETGDVRVGDSG